MKRETLYNDHQITLERFENGDYRVTLFNDDNHWHGDLTFNMDGVKFDDLSDYTT